MVAGVVVFTEIAHDRGSLYWLESRPDEGGRQVLVRRDDAGAIEDLTPPPTNVRTLVHEYGGGALTVGHGGVVYTDFADQRLYLIDDDGSRDLCARLRMVKTQQRMRLCQVLRQWV